MTLAFLQVTEGAHTLEDTIEIFFAANSSVRFGSGGVNCEAQFVELGLDQRRPFFSLRTVPLVLNKTVQRRRLTAAGLSLKTSAGDPAEVTILLRTCDGFSVAHY